MIQPPPLCVHFQNRAFLAVSGPDKLKFLNALLAGPVSTISPTNSLYTILLTPQGRLRCDLFITAWSDDLWILDVDTTRKDDLLRQLTLYKLRSEITLRDVTENYTVFGLFSTTEMAQSNAEKGSTQAPAENERLYVDPRSAQLGKRLLIKKNTEDKHPLPEETTDMNTYHRHRILCHVPVGGIDMPYEKAIPLECGLDRFGAIDWEKGCYVGQELTARTRYRGLVRKTLAPVQLTNSPQETAALDTNITNQTGEIIGEMRGIFGDLGMIFVRLDALPTLENETHLFYQQVRVQPLHLLFS